MADEHSHNATLNKWRRMKENSEQIHDAAKNGLKDFIKKSMRNKSTRSQVVRNLVDQTKSNSPAPRYKAGSGFNLVDEPDPTGLEQLPWDKDNSWDDEDLGW